MTDAELLRRWREGCTEAGEELIRAHLPRVRRFLASKVPHDADELVQRTLVRCVEAQQRFEERSTFRAYLLGVANRILLEYLREKGRADRLDPADSSLAALLPSPSRQASRARKRDLVAELLRGLPLEQQLALELHYWEDLTIAEVSAALGAPAGTIKSRLYLGRKALAAALQERGVELSEQVL